MAKTPPHPIRVDEDLWKAFGEAAKAMGSDRTKTLIAFMRRYVAATAPTQTDDGDHARSQSHSAT